ncbi:MAG TPA: hypothetical protein VF796_11175 [Humisphaera sp.]
MEAACGKRREPALGKLAETVIAPVHGDADAGASAAARTSATEALEVLDVAGVLRVVQELNTPRADRLKQWLASSAAERLADAADPEMAGLRARKGYEARGYPRRWVEKRVGGTSARQEATAEWYKRGAAESDQFRALTNAIVETAFGMDTTAYRAHKGLTLTSESLRDHMTGVELALTALGETLAVALHRDRDSQGFDALARDAKEAGEVVARTRVEIEERLGHTVISRGRRWRGGAEAPRLDAPRPDAGDRPRNDPDRPEGAGQPVHPRDRVA